MSSTEPADPAETPKPIKLSAGWGATAIVLFVIVAAVAGVSIWYLFQGQPLVVQGEADATRIDIAARVDGLVRERPVERGQDVAAGQLLLTIDNPELVAKLDEARAAKASASKTICSRRLAACEGLVWLNASRSRSRPLSSPARWPPTS